MRVLGLALLLASVVGSFSAPASAGEPGTAAYSPYDGRERRRVLWGDTHVHTNLSSDANQAGNLDIGPETAYRFARGEEVTSQNKRRAKLGRPLDFVVISDHAEALGLLPLLRAGDPRLLASPRWKRMYRVLRGIEEDAFAGWGLGSTLMEHGDDLFEGNTELKAELSSEAWNLQLRLAEQFNAPGVFSALIGFEYSPIPEGNAVHRNVIFRDDADKARQVLPFSAAYSLHVEELWNFMAGYEDETGGKILSIPHNANLSNGAMFSLLDSWGNPIDADYAKTRARFEPLFEVTQIKGDQESHPFLSPDDEFAGFEIFDKTNSFGYDLKLDSMLQHEYGRAALKLGLRLAQDTGVNPFRFGMIGSSDTHQGLPGSVEEDNYWGKSPGLEPGQERTTGMFMPTQHGPRNAFLNIELGASGLAAVWAGENTRAAIFDAMQRREVYATTGSRMTVRFFGGWSYEEADAADPHLALVGYAKGVPMGGELAPQPEEANAPSFLVAALRDPEGAHLDRIQIIKGWLAADGALHEKVYDVSLSDGRRTGDDGKAPPVGSTVDVANASFENTIGAAQLTAVWVDPDFDPGEKSFYYARAIEIPRPRWSTYESRIFGAPLGDGRPRTVQDRAYTSPIWYERADP